MFPWEWYPRFCRLRRRDGEGGEDWELRERSSPDYGVVCFCYSITDWTTEDFPDLHLAFIGGISGGSARKTFI